MSSVAHLPQSELGLDTSYLKNSILKQTICVKPKRYQSNYLSTHSKLYFNLILKFTSFRKIFITVVKILINYLGNSQITSYILIYKILFYLLK